MNTSIFTEIFPRLIINDALELREPLYEDAPVLLEYYSSDPRVHQYILAKKADTLLEAQGEVHFCRHLFVRGRGLYWTLAERASQRMIGAVGIYINPQHSRGELCYDLAHAYWGQGIMTQTLTVVIDYAFRVAQLNRLEATTLKINDVSNHLLEKLHFQHEATLKSYRFFQGRFYDVELLARINHLIK